MQVLREKCRRNRYSKLAKYCNSRAGQTILKCTDEFVFTVYAWSPDLADGFPVT